MNKYRVWMKTEYQYYIDIEAESLRDAADKARNIHSDYFHDDYDKGCTWKLSDVYRIDEDEEVDFTAEQIANGEAE